MKREFPVSMRKFTAAMIHAVAVVGFFMLFAIVYEPKALGQMFLAGTGEYRIDDMFSFNLSITCAIYLLSMVIMRLCLYLLKKKFTDSFVHYAIWCILETLVASAFISLFLVLISKGEYTYFNYLLQSASVLVGIVIYPYVLLAFVYVLQDSSRAEMIADENERIRFYDNRHLLKFITSASSILYIEAEENYIVIHYLENGILKKCQVRNSMKNIEPLCEKSGFVRVHRSYFLNPKHVTQLRKEKDGFYFADLDSGSSEAIPVSKRYYEALATSL